MFFIVLGIIFIFLTNKVNYRTSDFKVVVTLQRYLDVRATYKF